MATATLNDPQLAGLDWKAIRARSSWARPILLDAARKKDKKRLRKEPLL
jgi:hypothetical protein